jgi:hypothetical protein
MAKYAGVQFGVLLMDGYNIAPSLSDAVSMEKESVTQETNPFGATNITSTPVNIEKGALNIGGGFFDATTNALLGVASAIREIPRIVVAAIEDNIIGRHFMGFAGPIDTKYVLKDTKDQLTMANLTMLVSGQIDEGTIIQNLATFTASWDTKTGGANAPDAPVDYTTNIFNTAKDIASNSVANPTVITMKTWNGNPIPHNLTTGQKVLFTNSNSTPSLNGVQTVTVISPTTFSVPVNVTIGGTTGTFVVVNTNNGGVGYLEATAYSGFTGFVDKIMHSPDDSTYAALVTFTDFAAVAGPKKERISVAGFVDRYLSNNGTVTGAGSVTVFTGFARN